MQIVIKIDDKLYKKLQNEKKLSLGLTHIGMKLLDAPPLSSDTQLYNNIVDIGWAIKNGIPLPEDHGRLIDADMLEGKVEKHRKMLKISEYDRELILHYTDVEMAPTIIEADIESEVEAWQI